MGICRYFDLYSDTMDYFLLYIFIILSLFIAMLILFLSYFLVPQNYDTEKLSAYECGFDPFEDSRKQFDVKFYLVGILFIIFDLEISFLFPWAFCMKQISHIAFGNMVVFLLILTLGFVYEWTKGALDWN